LILSSKEVFQSCLYWKSKKSENEFEEWFQEHQDQCAANHEGSAGKMEVDAVREMFSRSEEMYGVKYSNYIGDGDSKTFKAILDLNPYDDLKVKKSECVGHVEKRMGSRLRNLKKKEKLGGKGKLTDNLIKKLTTYYGLAIRRNPDNVEEMEKSVMATYFHMISTNENPQHQYCPAGAESWCKWRIYEAAGKTEDYNHAPSLPEDLQKYLLPIYKDLSQRELLEKCLGRHTQNPNESFNALVSKLAPKHLNTGIKIIQIAAFIATVIFNEGYDAILKIMDTLDIVLGRECHLYAKEYKKERLIRQARRSLSSTKEARTARRLQQIEENEFYEEYEGLLYGPGIAD